LIQDEPNLPDSHFGRATHHKLQISFVGDAAAVPVVEYRQLYLFPEKHPDVYLR
jgi:hypothetical protein